MKIINLLSCYKKIPCSVKKLAIIGLVLAIFTIFPPLSVKATLSSLYLSPSSGTMELDNIFSVIVRVNSGSEAINAAEGTLIFNPNELNALSISKKDSIFTLWTTEPNFSNSAGSIVFGGGIPSNFTGISGNIITVIFKAKSIASAQVNFSSAAVLAADGKGTNILGNMIGGVYAIQPKAVVPLPVEAPVKETPVEIYPAPTTLIKTPLAPVISSITHPDPNKWYSNNNPEFSWELPFDVTAIKLLVDKMPEVLPSVLYTPPIVEKKLDNLEDGVWYFHIRFKNKAGWGAVTHQKVLIDTEPPKHLKIKIEQGEDLTNPSPILQFETTDSLSGVAYYEVKIDQEEPLIIKTAVAEKLFFKMPSQFPGKHTVIVKAVDLAGNVTTASADVVIEPIEPPMITEFPQSSQVGNALIIKGNSKYPEAAVTIFVKQECQDQAKSEVKTDSNGNWIFVSDKSLEKGTYQFWAEITDARGAKSNPTGKITIIVSLPVFLKVGRKVIDYLSIIAIFTALIVVLRLIISYSWRRVSFLKKTRNKKRNQKDKN